MLQELKPKPPSPNETVNFDDKLGLPPTPNESEVPAMPEKVEPKANKASGKKRETRAKKPKKQAETVSGQEFIAQIDGHGKEKKQTRKAKQAF
mmetsp:Transcript_29706/g.27177  ORF Transcript_29706/g.27177 Transcript_29706/m.27177 type:complete len:93 (-) Transcript_29706:108-386(-)|eukprot:CAMPEP_0114580842 /NCGR_PEP_ID=MMETSP0125-20121206/5031_1 /TAXON_ID=485358 ORGANISM="Aristerostoma sp., Strain ATCC 50986" /NCGR_SAMPLE_ID=MMETSP0125 /ASSEMBLY_ACC=CAM_ASM_000245 /LENGTH=92 /DNA_ID=CAMNT_0001772615 /DNA_START=2151 /DNA_END=2429 /DNA_ORIENTATION=-